MPDSCCSNYPVSMTFDNCTVDATDPIAPKALRTLPDDLDNIALIDEVADAHEFKIGGKKFLENLARLC